MSIFRDRAVSLIGTAYLEGLSGIAEWYWVIIEEQVSQCSLRVGVLRSQAQYVFFGEPPVTFVACVLVFRFFL